MADRSRVNPRGVWLLALLALAGCPDADTEPARERIEINGSTFSQELAVDPAARELGLMHRESIPEDGGMLFVFPDSQVRSFWMGHCPIDMDLIFLDPRGRVTATHRMKAETPQGAAESEAAYRARMPPYSSVYPAQFAIELQAGWLDRLNLQVEDKIPLDVDRLKAMAN